MKTTLCRTFTEDGLELHGILYEPDQKTKKILAHVHGMAGNFYENKFLDNIAKTLTDNGIAFCPFNNRGNSNMTTFLKKTDSGFQYPMIGDIYEKFEDSLIDIKAHIDFLEKKEDYEEIHLSGHSLGAPKATYYLGKTHDKRIKSLSLLSPADMIGLAKDEKEYEEKLSIAKKMIKDGIGNKLMSQKMWGEYPLTADTYLNLFSEDSEVNVLPFHDSASEFKVFASITQPIFTAMGKKDDVLIIPIEDIMKMIKEKAKASERCECAIIGNADHGYRGEEQREEEKRGQVPFSFILKVLY